MDFCCFYFPLFCIHWLMGDSIPTRKAMGNRETSGEGIFFAEFIGLFLTMLG